MRVVIDLTSLADNFSGIERYACEMTKAMIGLGTPDVFVLVFKDEVFADFAPLVGDSRVEAVVIDSHGSSKLLFSQVILPWALCRIRADVFLFLAFPAPVLFWSRKAVSTIHDLSCWDCPETMTAKSRLLWRVLDAKAARCSLVNTISEFSKSRIVGRYQVNPAKVVVAYCGVSEAFATSSWRKSVNEQEVRKRYGLPERYILTLSTIEPRKNIPELITAWREYRRNIPDSADLVLAGRKGWKTDALLEALDKDELEHVHVTGFVDDVHIAAVYGMAEAFVFPSRYEGFGLPPVEARLSGARVICSDIPCLREIMGDAAEYYPLGDAHCLAEILADGDCGAEVDIARDARNLPERYVWERSAARLLDELKQLVVLMLRGS